MSRTHKKLSVLRMLKMVKFWNGMFPSSWETYRSMWDELISAYFFRKPRGIFIFSYESQPALTTGNRSLSIKLSSFEDVEWNSWLTMIDWTLNRWHGNWIWAHKSPQTKWLIVARADTGNVQQNRIDMQWNSETVPLCGSSQFRLAPRKAVRGNSSSRSQVINALVTSNFRAGITSIWGEWRKGTARLARVRVSQARCRILPSMPCFQSTWKKPGGPCPLLRI